MNTGPGIPWVDTFRIALASSAAHFLALLPAILVAGLLLVAGWYAAAALGRLAAHALRAAGFQRLAERTGLTDFIIRAGVDRTDASGVLGRAVCWVLRLLCLQVAAEILGLLQLSAAVGRVLAYLPNVAVAAAILMAAGFLARAAERSAAPTAEAQTAPALLPALAYWGVLGLGIVAALNQLGIAPFVVNTLLVGVVAAVSLAFGISFGLGGRDAAAQLTQQWTRRSRSAGSTPATRSAASGAYRDPLTRPYPEGDEDEAPRVIRATSATPIPHPVDSD